MKRNMKPLLMRMSFAIGFVLLFGLALIPHAALADMGSTCAANLDKYDYNNLITTIMRPIDNASRMLFTGSAGFATWLYRGLAVIEVVWFVGHTLVFKHEMHELLHGFGFKIVSLLFLMALILGLSADGGLMVKKIVFHDFASIGQTVGKGFTADPGFSGGVAPSDGAAVDAAPVAGILGEGDCAMYMIISAPTDAWNTQETASQPGGLAKWLSQPVQAAQTTIAVIGSLPQIILGFLIGFLVGCTYLYLAGLMLMAIVDGLITLGVGMLLLGFAGSRWTSAMADKYTGLIVHTGFKVLAINLVAGLGMGMLYTAINTATTLSVPLKGPALSYGALASLGIISLLVAFLAKNVNGIANTLAGSPSINLGGSVAATAGAAAVVGVAAATGGVIGGVQGGKAALNAMNAGGSLTAGKTENAVSSSKQDAAETSKPPSAPSAAVKGTEQSTAKPPAAPSASSTNDSSSSTTSNGAATPSKSDKSSASPGAAIGAGSSESSSSENIDSEGDRDEEEAREEKSSTSGSTPASAPVATLAAVSAAAAGIKPPAAPGSGKGTKDAGGGGASASPSSDASESQEAAFDDQSAVASQVAPSSPAVDLASEKSRATGTSANASGKTDTNQATKPADSKDTSKTQAAAPPAVAAAAAAAAAALGSKSTASTTPGKAAAASKASTQSTSAPTTANASAAGANTKSAGSAASASSDQSAGASSSASSGVPAAPTAETALSNGTVAAASSSDPGGAPVNTTVRPTSAASSSSDTQTAGPAPSTEATTAPSAQPIGESDSNGTQPPSSSNDSSAARREPSRFAKAATVAAAIVKGATAGAAHGASGGRTAPRSPQFRSEPPANSSQSPTQSSTQPSSRTQDPGAQNAAQPDASSPRGLTQSPHAQRMEMLQNVKSKISSVVEQHHDHTAVPSAPTITHQ